MSPLARWRQKIAAAEEACRKALEELPALARPEECYSLLSAVTLLPSSTSLLARMARNACAEPHAFERWVLLNAALEGIQRAGSIPVYNGVKSIWAEEVLSFAQPPPAWHAMFDVGHVRFREMAQIVTWRRFPAGQLHWDRSALPRSFLLRAPPAELPRMIACWMRDLRGFAPFIETHVNERRKNRLTLTEAEGIKSYYLMARSVELQPEVLGLIGIGWLYSPATGEVSPRLAWLREFLVREGAVAVSSVGPAPSDAGFLVGSEERRRLYEEGKYRPTIGCVIWPRRRMIEWASRQEKMFAEDDQE